MKSKKALIVIVLIAIFLIGIFVIFLLKTRPKSSTSFHPSPKTFSYGGVTYEGTYERYNKIVDKAVNSGNPIVCDEINFGQDHGDYFTSAEESRYFCKSDYAVGVGDIEYCRTLDMDVKYKGTISQRNNCLRGLAQKLKDEKLCEEMVDKSGAWFTEQYVKGCKDSLRK